MKNVLIISSIFFICYLNSQIPQYRQLVNNKNYRIFNIDINNDGIKDKVFYNKVDNNLYFFKHIKKKYVNVYSGDNFSMNGVYSLSKIISFNENGNVLYLKNSFNGSGGQTIEYFISFDNHKWYLKKSITKISKFSETKVCEYNYHNKIEKCIDDDNNELVSNSNINFVSIEYLFSLLNSLPINSKSISQYEELCIKLNKSYKYSESIFLSKEILKTYPQRTIAYLNLADAYWDLGNNENAKENYKKYLSLMKSQKKDLKKIPKRVYQRIK